MTATPAEVRAFWARMRREGLVPDEEGRVYEATPEAPEGFHLLGEEVYKVQVAIHGSGQKYAKRLDAETGEFAYEGRAPLWKLSGATRLTLDQARHLGRLYGRCVVCGATLTNEQSIAAGIGPVCAQYVHKEEND